MSDVTKRLTSLTPKQRELLLRKTRKEQAERTKSLSMPIVSQERGSDGNALSFAQERLWFLDQFEPLSTAYTIPAVLRVQGKLSLEALQRSFSVVVQRHESLRTIFTNHEGHPAQVIVPSMSLIVPLIDLRAVHHEQREESAEQIVQQEMLRLFDLSTGPLLRVHLLWLDTQEYVLILTMHHIVSDGWSMNVLIRELSQSYLAEIQGEGPPLPPLPIQYADYALWQRQLLQGETRQRLLDYWKQQLTGAPQLLNLPTDHPRLGAQSSAGMIRGYLLSTSLLQKLQALSLHEGVTLFMTLLASFKVLLMRYSGQSDIVVGTPIANRTRREIEALVGFFVNTLVLRTDLSGDPDFCQLLARVRQVTLQAYAHQDLPFDQLVEALQPERSLSYTPLFQVLFQMQNSVPTRIDLAGLTWQTVELARSEAKFDVSVDLLETAQGLSARIEYNASLFEAVTIERLLDHWRVIVEGVVADPTQVVTQLPVLTKVERHSILSEWNTTRRDVFLQGNLMHLLTSQRVANPDQVAVVFAEQQLTYRELHTRADQLAAYLQRLGIGPDSLVGVCLERSLELVVALLAILKAGGAYVPLDPSYPQERLRFMLQDCQASVVLVQRSTCDVLAGNEACVVSLDEEREALSACYVGEFSTVTVQPEHLAYVIYTSGSTGRPKGVAISQQAISNFLQSMREQPGLEPHDRLLAVTTISFDIAGLEVFLPLCVGAPLVLGSLQESRDGQALGQLIAEQAITVMQATPTTWQLLVQAGWQGSSHLKALCGGEALPPALAAQLAQRCAVVWNMYGPTETTVWSTCSQVSAVSPASNIGRPIANTELYILDQQQSPVPIGVQGELYIGGEGLARGYLQRPDVTAERFVPDPWSQKPGTRLYRTGDLVRYHADGSVEHFGRLDRQVKIRGYRIEVGEIEAVLLQEPSVCEAVVQAQAETTNGQRLVAYVVGLPGSTLNLNELRGHVRACLPAYMLPSAFVALEALPLTPNGKVDWHALPLPDEMIPESDESGVEQPLEGLLLGVWRSVLGRKQIGRHENFFEAGGHSLLATQLIGRIRQIFKLEIPLRAVFEAPTIAEFVQRIEQSLRKGEASQLPPLRATARPEKLLLSYAQQRLWFLEQWEPGNPAYLLASAQQIKGAIDAQVLEQSVQKLLARHESLRTTFAAGEELPLQLIHPVRSLRLPLIDLQGLGYEQREREVRRLIGQEAHTPCDVVTGPLWRITLLRLAPQEHVLLLTIHHLITDGWSMGVLVRDLISFYQAQVRGIEPTLPVLPIQYSDYALWQRQWLQEEALEQQLTYWKQQLTGAPALLELPTDHPRPQVQTFAGARLVRLLAPELLQRLQQLSQQEGVTLFMTLLAAWQILLSRYTGQTDLVVGTPVANRTHVETENVLGFFVNTLVLRIDLSGQPDFRELLARVREVTLQAYAHQDLPFEKLVDALHVERSLSHSPLFQSAFILQNAPQIELEAAGLSWQAIEVEHTATKFDLTLELRETQQGLSSFIEYNTTLFEASTIERLLDHWQVVVEGIVADPSRSIDRIPLLTESEQQTLLYTWNKTQQVSFLHRNLVQLLALQDTTSERVAVFFAEQQLTYRELHTRANQLAAYLQRLGVGPDTFVGVCLERSLELLVVLLAILKAGGVYVPLDPDYPQERLRYMLDDAHIAVLLTQSRLQDRLPLLEEQITLLNLDLDASLWAGEELDDPLTIPQPEQLAYMIYTSGSTGRPKGVMNTHEGISNRLLWMQQTYQLKADDCVLQKTPFSFDVSVWEFFWPLLCGARLVMARPGGQGDPSYLKALLQEQQISTLHFVPSMLQAFLLEPAVQECYDLRRVICSGEALSAELQARFFATFPASVQLHNLYGPTEAAVDVTSWRCSRESQAALVPIGGPIANIQVYLLDAALSPVPIGVPGNLYLGGIGLARGYSGRPDLTAELFGPHPFSSEPGARLYPTGDLARYRADGVLEFLGRSDYQVKLRGFRIELQEIEACLQAHAAVQEAIVMLREETQERKYLVAYVVPRGEQDADLVEHLRAYLLHHLAAYMVPTFFQLLDALPLTPNGKVDRRMLPVPQTMTLSHTREVFAPETVIGQMLAQIWQRVLGVEQIGAYDNFFALGGDSILSLQVVARARQAGLALTPKNLFQYQTLAQLAAVTTRIGSTATIPLARSGPVPLTPIQHFFFQRALPRWQHFNQALLLQVPAAWDGALLRRVFEIVLLRHDALQLRYVRIEDGWLQSLLPSEQPVAAPFARIDLRMLSQGEQATAIEVLSSSVQSSLDPQHGPSMRIVLFDLGDQQAARLLMVAHHLVIDGVSWRVLLEDVQTTIDQLRPGEIVSLPTPTVSFQQWAQYLEKFAHSALLQEEQDYWLTAQQVATLPLPLDLEVVGNGTRADERRLSCALTPEETQSLLREATRAYRCQPQELLLVALLQVLADWIGTRSIRLDLEGHGREDPAEEGLDVSRTVGWFTSLYPVLFTLPERGDEGDWIRAVKEQLRAVPNKGIGYGLLRYLGEDSTVGKLLQAAPSAQIIFNYWGQFDQDFTFASTGVDGLRLAAEESGSVDAPENPRSHLLSVSGMVVEKQLQLWFTYSARAHLDTTIAALSAAFLRNLRALLTHCLSPDAGGYTPSDFPLAALRQEVLDRVLADRREIEDVYPLTPSQHGMLFHTLYHLQSGVYVEQMLCRLHGELDLMAFERAWQTVIAQHPALRASFVWQDLDTPVQLVWEHVALPMTGLDWRDRSSEQQHIDLETFLQHDRRLGFDPAQVPLMRLTLIRYSANVIQVIWSHHHLLLDGWSTSMVLQEVFACYHAYVQGQQHVLEPRRPYRDYLAWLQKQDLRQSEAYWRTALLGIRSPTQLGIDRVGVVGDVEQGYAVAELRLTAETTADWLAFTRQQQLTLNTLMQGVWALVLSRYSDQSDLLFGNVVAGRPPELLGAERMVGVFIHTLPVRIRLRSEDTVGDWLKRLQEQQAEQQQYAYSSLVQVQGWSEIPHDAPLFEVLFVFENYPLESALREEQGSLSVDATQAREQTNYPLTIVVFPGQELRISLRYERQRFAQPMIQQLLQHMYTVLEQMVAYPERRLVDVTLLTLEERLQLLETWNTTRVTYGQKQALHQLFEQQVERTPEAIALVYEEQHLTYQDLNLRANQLAHYLRSCGVGLDQPVGLFMERSLEVLIGLLAILKAGGAYVPFDASYPFKRLAFMLQDAGLSMLLTQSAFLASARELAAHVPEEILLLCLDQPPPALTQQATDNPQTGCLPEHLAYVMYTSGSTGQPKGVALSHEALYNLLLWQEHDCPLRPGTVVMQFSPLGFDASCEELFSTWLRGGKIVELSTDEMRRDPEALLSLMAREQVERWFVPYAGLQNVALWAIQHAQTSTLSLRAIMTAGEQLQVTPAIVSWLQHVPGCTLYNYYGPTESHVVTFHTLCGEPAQWPLFPPIGRPIANTQIYLLDRNLHPVPIGVAGELYIGGVSLARGYIHRPDWTAERFVPDMWGQVPGARLYRTGDLARYDSSGVIEFLGRIDMQVKLRGYRVEPGEIEAVLQDHPAVQEAIVVLRERDRGEKFLVAYVVSRPGMSSSYDDLHAWLRQQVPDYMVPASLVFLEALPLTPSGKIDRRALPAPDLGLLHDGVMIAPRTPLEELVSMIWADLLHLPLSQLSIHDNFFALGGHSLLATQTISRLRQSTQVDVPLRLLFEAPTIVMLARQIELLRQGSEQPSVPALLPVARSQNLPLSFAQERLWFLQQLEPLSTAYHISVALRLCGSLVFEALEWSLQTLIERHESLRTTVVVSHEGEPVQVVAPALSLDVPVIDVGSLPLPQRDRQIRDLFQQVSQVPFDLAHGPLLSLYLLRLEEQDQILVLNMHHIITDGWSSHVLVRDLTAFYQAWVQAIPVSLPALPIQYADYALWQRQWLRGEVLEQQLGYWKQQLDGAPALLELPTDHPRPAVQTFVGARHTRRLALELQQQLQSLSQREGVTLFMTLLAAFQVLLLRYSGQTDIVVGTPIANRTRAEVENLIGMFVNTLVLRTNLAGNLSFRDLLMRVREVTLQAYTHQDLPFEQLVEALQIERSLNHTPLFQIFFVLQNTPQAVLDIAGLTWEPVELEHTTTKFDLSLILQESADGLLIDLEYNTALFEASTITRLLDHWHMLLQALVSDPKQRITEVSLLMPDEREQLMVGWNQTTTTDALPLSLHAHFEQQVARTPEAIALVFEEQHITYTLLAAQSDQLAAELQRRGVGPEVLVGVCLPRTPTLVIVLLAILKAGGAYVPLDPAYPSERLAAMLQDASVGIVLTQTSLQARLPHDLPEVLCLDREWLLQPQQTLRACLEMPNRLAYVIYTSGSTGKPKGVMGTHEATVNRLSWMWRSSPFLSAEVACQKTNLSFVDAVWEIFGPLCQGVPLVIIPDDVVLDIPRFIALLERHAVSRIVLVPSLLRAVLAEEQELHTHLRLLSTWISSGEPLALDLAQRFQQELPDARLINLYGSSEVAADVTFYALEPHTMYASVPVGRPIANTQIYVLDAALQLVPIGLPGELYVGGMNLARGYLDQPALTAERFLADPFSSVPGSRLYRTGDVVRYWPDGNLEYLGRVDRQVKIRGYRIELGEIEAALGAHPDLLVAVVLVREDRPEDKRLVTYLVTQPGAALSNKELLAYLQERLPSYMLPAAFVFLEALPLMPNGKVDRWALPAPEVVQEMHVETTGQLRTPLEELVMVAWSQVLGHSQVGSDDNFFELGGHSLLATQLVARLRGMLMIDVPVRLLFEAPTLASFAQRVEQILRQGDASQIPALSAVARPEELPLSYAQQRLWFLDQWEPESTAYLIPSVLRMRGEVTVQALAQSVQALTDRHESLRTHFELRGEHPVQIIQPAGPVRLPVIDLHGLGAEQREQEVQRLINQEASCPCALARGPLLRVTLLRLERLEHVLCLSMHHIITDGWSTQILVRDLTTLYQAQIQELPVVLPALPIQYADYALWQRQWLQGEVLEQQLSYWKRHLAGVPGLLEVPTDHPRPAVQTFVGARHLRMLSPEVVQQVQDLSQQEGVTLFMTLLAAFQVLLMRYSRQTDIIVGTPIANRTQTEAEQVIGLFVNTLVLRSDLSGNPSFRELLARVREVSLQAYTHQDLPFEQVVEALTVERSLSHSPLFQVFFALQNTPSEVLHVAGLTWEAVELEHTTTKFDLSLILQEREQGLQVLCEYNRALFETATIERLLTHWQILLEAIVQQADLRIEEIPLLTQAEREQQLIDWNASSTSYQDEALSLHQRIEQQVERTPEAIAVVFEQQQLSYAELNTRANQLAHHLRRLGVGPDILVALCLERSLEMLIGLLAVLKAGGAYVPIDPGYPAERITRLLEECNARVVLSQQHLPDLHTATSSPILLLDAFWQTFYDESTSNLPSQVTPENLVYMIYTSGSTGFPKGAGVYQKGFLNLLTWFLSEFHLNAQDQGLVVTSFSFDLTQKNLFAPLLMGGCVNIQPAGYDIDLMRQSIVQRQITRLNCTPSMFYPLLEMAEASSFASLESLRTVFLGGEAIALNRLWPWMHAPQFHGEIVNTYGPTECSDVVAYHRLTETALTVDATIPLGRPIANTQLLLLDEQMQLVPPLVAGEIYVAGRCVGAGYLSDAALTATKFVPNPFAEISDERLYRTGDRARYRVDGTIEYLGRLDFQIKLRGIRIELGEIEEVLRGHPAVQECVVLARAEEARDTYLVAYLVGRAGQTLVMSELRTFLQEHLPSYMLPGAWIFLDALPLTSNGKLDRRALPIPAETLEDDAILQAQTPLEELVASAWSAVLGRGQVGRHDNFFELGGHSLLATQLIARLRGMLRIDVPVRLLFEAPTLASFAQRVEQILRQGDASQIPALSAVVRPEELPLSYAQQRLWFLDQWEPESTAYLIPSVLRMRGEVTVQALAQSVQALTDRHESLRTHFELRGEHPVQIIQPAGPVRLLVIDLHGLGAEQREQEVQRLINQEASCPCALARGQLLRVTLLRLERLEHVLCLSMHHIITDGWSTQILVRDLTTLYQAQVQELPVVLPALPIQYADYALWQRRWLQGEVLEAQLAYWKRHLAGAPALLELSTDHPRPALQTFVGARHLRMLSPEVVQHVQDLSQQEGVTLFMTLLAAFQVLLMRYSRQSDIVVGTPIANRAQAEVENVIGFFVNTLVLRSDLSGNPSFRELLARVREVSLQAYTHQDLPFEQVVEALTVERSLSHSPLFQVFFALQNTPSEALHVAGLTWEAVELEHTTTKFDLSLILQEREQGLQVLCEYNRALFETATIERLLTHWQILLEAIVQRADLRIEEIPLLTQGEHEQQLIHWNPQLPQDQPTICLHQLFEQQVERTPDALAVVYEHAVLSYQELDLRANRLAHLLQRRGVGPDVFVGVVMDRSLELVIALLAVLKAGGAYVPLDPTYPADRLAFMIEDAHMPVVLTLEHVRASLPATSATILCLTTEMTSPDDDADVRVASPITSGNLAYMIYTSGSTGKPKGTMIPHANVVRLFTMTEAWFHFDTRDCWTLFHSYAFDFSVWEMWGALLSGGRLIVVPYLVSRAPAEFYRLLSAEHVTVLNQTPSAFRQLLQVDTEAAALVALRLVIFGGEALDPALFSPWIARHGDQHPQLVNMYGTTETTVHVTYRRLYEHGSEMAPGGSIGRPIADLHSYVLDRQQQIVPIGVPGELYVGGRGLAYGYWQQAGLTAERFVPHPFGAEVGARLYKTGDLVRSLVDGSLEYLGRVDQQVKLRGYRIELGEIESVLEEHPAVQEAVVLAREEEARDTYLVAYLVGRAGQTLVMSELRTFLQEHLPSYMLPGAWVRLDALPLTSNGKLDRQALPVPAERLEEDVAILQAQTPLEELVASAWSAVLGRGHLGRHDNFFDLGGHSLLATQLIARLREMLGIDVPVRLIFEAPTLASLAQRVEQILRQADASQVPELSAVVRPEELPLSYAQQRLWFLDQLEPESTAYLIPSLLRMEGLVNVQALELSLRELVRRHESLRTTFAEQAGQPVQVIYPLANDYALPVIDLQGLQPEQRAQQVQRLAHQEAQHPCDLASGPLLRTFLLRQGREELVLLLTLHHIIADGWSMGVLWRELSILYSSYVSGKASSLAPLPIQYADYALWQRQWLQGEVLEAQLAYWKRQLTGIVPLQLPFDRPRSSQKSHQGATYTFTLTQDLTRALVDLSSREQITLFMTLLAVFQTLLQRISGQNDIVVGTDVANRHRVELEGLIGFFVNQLILRTNLSKNPTFRELLKQVRTISLEAYAHQDLPFEQLVAALRTQRSGLPSSLFQVKFLLDKTFELAFKTQDAFLVPDITVSQEGLSPAPNRDEDLLLHMSEVPEGLAGTFIYNADLFDEATIALMAQRFVTLVESICADPDSRLDMLKILTEKEEEKEAIKQKKSIDNDFSQFRFMRPKPMRLQEE